MATVRIENLAVQHPSRSKYCDVENVSFTVEDGEFFCLVGPANAGKTSTLRLIAGLDAPDTGKIQFDGRTMTDASPSERGASMLFQNLALYPNRTGYANISHPLKVAGVPEDERRRRVDELAETLDITHLLDRTPGTFSGGEKQRVGLGRALIKDASVHLLDEPLGGLDAKLKTEMRVELARLQAELGETFVLATHDQQAAMSVADRIAVCRDGRIEQIGTPEELYDRPTNRFVGGFIGEPTMNFLDGALADEELGAGVLTLSAAGLNDVPDAEYLVGIRPQDVTVTQSSAERTAEAEVVVTEYLGNETVVDLRVGDLELRAVTKESYAKELDRGDSVGLSLTAADTYLFDSEENELVYAPSR